jgi:hypothetical protein
MISRIPSVKDTYFQHKLLTRIHGKPTYESLQNGLTELKANASSVPSTLGGGLHGHLGLLLSDARYTSLAHAVLFVTPGNPGPFVPPAGGTGPQIEAAKDVWKDSKQTFELCQATEKALIAQIVETIDPIYLRALLNRATGQYSSSIRALLLHLFTTYGRITPQQVKAKEMELLNMHYDISQPVDNVFNSIDDLSDLAESANSPMSHQQLIDLAYVIFAKQPILQPDLRLWNRKPAAERTWDNMMIHLRDAQADLSSLPTAGDMYNQRPHHEANITTMADLVAQRLLDDQRAHANEQYPLPTQTPDNPRIPEPPPFDQLPPDPFANMANSLQRRETDLHSREASLMTQMQEMMTMMRTNGGTGTPTHRSQSNNARAGRSSYLGRGGGRGTGAGRNTTRPTGPRSYCHTHGACAHNGAACLSPATGHQSAATFANMQNGSTQGCYWLQR